MADRSGTGTETHSEAADATIAVAEATAATAVTAAALSPAARKFLIDITFRGGAFLARKLLGKRLSAMEYTPKQASQILSGRGLHKAVASAAVTRLGFKSLPKSLVVGGVVLAKTLYDRKRAKEAKKALRK